MPVPPSAIVVLLSMTLLLASAALGIAVKPVPIEPAVNVPTLVKDEETTVELSVVPVSVPAGAADKNANVLRVPPAPTFNVEPSVPARVRLLLAARVFAFVIDSVPVVLGMVKPFMVVAVAVDKTGVPVRVGLDDNTTLPDPVAVV